MPTIAPGPTAMQAVLQFMRDPLQMFSDAQAQWGDLVRFSAMGYEFYQVTSPELAQHILTDPNFEMSVLMDHPFVGKGLANNIGESWQQQRRLMQPHFHNRAIAHLADTMLTTIDETLATWRGKSSLDVFAPLLDLHHRLLGKTVLNIDFAEHEEFWQALRTIRVYLNRRFQALVTVPESIPTPRNLAFKRAVTSWDSHLSNMMPDADSGDTMLSLLRNATDAKTGYQMSDQQLRDEINTIFFNGYEDPAATVTWALYLLSQNSDIQAQLREEITGAIGNNPPTIADLSDLPFLTQTLQETMRLYPTTWAVIRDAQAATKLADYDIPAGASVQATIYLLHRHPDYWQQPEQFNPSRFAGDYPKDAYMPYGYGARQCIGRAFADMEMKLMLIRLLQAYRFEFIQQTVVADAMASLHPKGGLQLRLHPNS